MSNPQHTFQETPTPQSLEQFERRYRQFYTLEAQGYDQIRFSDSTGQLFNIGEQAMVWRLLGARPGQMLLDVAAGTGRIATYLAERGLSVFAYDLTPNMLRKAQARAAVAELSNLRCVGGNGRVLPFKDGQFDAVISIRFLHLFPTKYYRPFILEMWRVLRPGGVLLVQFDSALAGAGAVWGRELYRRVVLGHKPRYFLLPNQLPKLFAGIEPISLHGFSPFGGHFIRRLHADSTSRLEALLAEGQWGFLANHVFVRAIKG